nr:hypothetical protein [Tanacetum cinerariifolium]
MKTSSKLIQKRNKCDILLVQVYVDDIIFGSIKKEMCDAFEILMHEKFQMSSMGELTFFWDFKKKQKKEGIFISQDKYVAKILKRFGFLDVKKARTLMETLKPLLKDEDGEEVDVHMYRSMIASLMYLTSSRPDIMFVVCACARYQVTPKVSHLHVVKRIFRYLKGQPKLGLWYLKDSLFDLVAYTDSDYAGTMVANFTIEAEYIVASSFCGQIKTVNDDVRLQALIDGKKVVITEASIRHDLKLNDAEGTSCLSNAVIFEELAKMGSTMASAIICLANNQKFNFSKYILDNLKKNLEAGVPFYMFLRFIQVFVNHQLSDMSHHKGIFVNPSLTKKVFANMKRVGTGFSRAVTPLFGTMMVHALKEETKVSPTEIHIEDHVPTTSNDPLPSGEDRMKLKELMDLCTNLSNKVLDLENKVNLENVYNLDMAHEETVLSMQDVEVQSERIEDADVNEVAKEIVEVMKIAKIIVDEGSTTGGELNAANEKPVSATPTNITTAQPSEATQTTVDITTAPKAKGIVFHDKKESTTRIACLKSQVKDKGKAKIEAEWNADMKDNIDRNEVDKQVQSRQSDAVRKYQALKTKHVSVAQARKNMMIYLKIDFFKGMSYEEIRPLFEEEYNKEDLKVLWKIVKDRFKESQPKEVLDVFLWHTLKQMFNEVRLQVDYEVEIAYDLLRLASKTKSWLWHRHLSHLNFDAINHLARQGLVRGLPKLKFKKDHLCSACAMGKSKKKSHKPKSEDTNQEKLYLLHMDLCGPMHVESVNGKKYILVIVDDYSRFTLAEAVATACYTQNRSIIRLRFGKTPYELLHNKLHDLSFLYVFGAICYSTNDSENLGKLQPKVDIRIFIGYASTKKAFWIYNRRTRRIVETIHVDFDELTEMASKQSSSGPALNEMTPATISSGLMQKPSSSTPCVPPSIND